MNNFDKILENEPSYRRDQVYQAWFNPEIDSFNDVTTLSKELRIKLSEFSWLPVKEELLSESKIDKTKKALLKLDDGNIIETVLMCRNVKKKNSVELYERYTVCVSSQVGCPMGCVFCATGQAGFTRNLNVAEIVGQYRFWQRFLAKSNNTIDNIVFMGQGEPLLNFEEVKLSINLFLKYADIGQRKITISTSGVVDGMKKMISDDDFPAVRFALSLHSAIEEDRRKIIPSQPSDFFEFLVEWSKDYHKKFFSRTHFIGLEYLFIENINDSEKHLKALVKLASKLGRVRINLIPYNEISDKSFQTSSLDKMKQWQQALMKKGFVVTIRVSQGGDIAAACGQLAGEKK